LLKNGKETYMFTRKNAKNRTAFVGNVTRSGFGVFYSVPMKGAKVGQRLTLRSGVDTIDLTGSQVRALTRVISTAKRLAK
jgi:hypothetical protein